MPYQEITEENSKNEFQSSLDSPGNLSLAYSIADEDDNRELCCSLLNTYRRSIAATFLLVLVCIIILGSKENGFVRNGVDSFFDWMATEPVWGIIAFIALYAIGTCKSIPYRSYLLLLERLDTSYTAIFLETVLFIPGSILTVGAGFSFASVFGFKTGLVLASISVFIGAVVGSMSAFLLGRYLFYDFAQKLSDKYATLKALDSGTFYFLSENSQYQDDELIGALFRTSSGEKRLEDNAITSIVSSHPLQCFGLLEWHHIDII